MFTQDQTNTSIGTQTSTAMGIHNQPASKTEQIFETIFNTKFAIDTRQSMRGSWAACNIIDLCGGKRVLVVSTHKTCRGVLTSYTVNTMGVGGALSWDVFGDFNKTTEYKGVRCTEKTVAALHSQAMDVLNLHSVLAAAIAYYASEATAETV